MANATVTPTRQHSTTAGITYIVYGTIAISASPDVYVTGGLTLNFTQSNVKATRTPIWVEIMGQNGYEYSYVNGTNATNGKLKILTTAATELAASAIPATVSGDTIAFKAEFKGML